MWIINGGTTTQCFNVETGARKGDIKGLEIFEHCFLYTAYAGDTTFRKIQNTLHTWLKYLIPIFTLYIYIYIKVYILSYYIHRHYIIC